MKKLFAILSVLGLCFAVGCSNNKESARTVSVDIVTESIVRDDINTQGTTVATAQTTAATEQTIASTAGETTAAPTMATVGDVRKEKLSVIEGTLDTAAKAGSSNVEGRLSFAKDGFTFTPNAGTEFKIDIKNILLVVVEYKMESQGETLSLLTSEGQYKFSVEDGYCIELSKYLIISEAQAQKSVGILKAFLVGK